VDDNDWGLVFTDGDRWGQVMRMLIEMEKGSCRKEEGSCGKGY